MWLFYLYVFALGLIIGSFINVCALRYDTKEDAIHGRSHCPQCNHTLRYYDLIPLFSWIFLKGKCRYCKAKISIRYPLIELITAIVFVLIFNKFLISYQTIIYLIIATTLIYAALVDMQIMIIPDRTHIILVICAIILILFNNTTLFDKLIGALIVSIPLLIIAYITKGMGYGDVKLMASAGLILGVKGIILSIIIGSILGSIYGIIQMRTNDANSKTEMPLGPHLIIAIIFTMLYGNTIINWYIQTFF